MTLESPGQSKDEGGELGALVGRGRGRREVLDAGLWPFADGSVVVVAAAGGGGDGVTLAVVTAAAVDAEVHEVDHGDVEWLSPGVSE